MFTPRCRRSPKSDRALRQPLPLPLRSAQPNTKIFSVEENFRIDLKEIYKKNNNFDAIFAIGRQMF